MPAQASLTVLFVNTAAVSVGSAKKPASLTKRKPTEAPSTVLASYVTVVPAVALDSEPIQKACWRFKFGLLPTARFKNWLFEIVMLLFEELPFSQMPMSRSGNADWALRMLMVLPVISRPS